jgi:hypothetical protein
MTARSRDRHEPSNRMMHLPAQRKTWLRIALALIGAALFAVLFSPISIRMR